MSPDLSNNQPKQTTGRILEPSKFTITPVKPDRLYPDDSPDNYGQVNNPDKDRSRLGMPPNTSASDHYHSDCDSSPQAQHHSLGANRNQAAPGNHSHDGVSSAKIGPMEMDPTPGNEGKTRPSLTITGSKGGNAALASLLSYLQNFFNFRDLTT